MLFRFERARSRALARSTSPAIAVAGALYRARARGLASQTWHVGSRACMAAEVASGPVDSGSGTAARVHLATQIRVPGN